MSKGTVNIPITHYDDLKSIIGKWKESHTQTINKIAELEKELKKYKCLDGDLIYIDKKELLQRDLEQQALACDWIYTKLPNYSSENLSVITARRLELVTQANALKEPKI
jgi:hypothetical protein